MKELIKTFLETSKERIKNPIIGSFIFSWIVFNWESILIILFSTKNIEEKIKAINLNNSSTTNLFWYPLAFSLFYILILPYVMWLIEKLLNTALEGRKNNVTEGKVFDIKSNQEIAKEEIILENIRADYKEKSDLNNQINSLNEKLKEKNFRIEVLENETEELIDQNKKFEHMIDGTKKFAYTPMEKEQLNNQYEDFKNSELYEYFNEIGSQISSHNNISNRTENIIIEKFIHSDLIIKLRDDENNSFYYNFTDKGKYFWKNHVLNMKIIKPIDLPF